ncbi:NAD-dependent protein deacylase [Fusibacter ferrireducens]|uniref:protein acetyllysine N-acetyltransferase n=1 Tax=Fusibacter ferrireducens TaxID=2785058 RepID=A0ABS0A0D6_9FIRM|nr:NAD-dependent protein deacylase [Fusibacter ferrireducens]MBF4695898.1 NAD-dependent protein deacylase [Fusibacter ferrireducens]
MSIDTLKKLIHESKNIVLFGGAGTSTESNVLDFRSENGLYSLKKYDVSPEEILSHDYFYKHPDRFYAFLKEYLLLPNIKPHKGHFATVALEAMGLSTIITQNIDGLHQAAGSSNVIELHGSVHRHYCTKCHAFYDMNWILNTREDTIKCPLCEGLVKPDVVLYGEPLDQEVMSKTVKAIQESDLLIVAGTSLVVYPAASFLRYYKGKNLVLINKTETPYDHTASLVLRESYGDVFDQLIHPF